MLQSKPQQLLIRYMTSLRQATELRPEDVGAVRMAMSMALGEMQAEHQQNLAEMDGIVADLLLQRDELRIAAATDAAEILRLQTLEDRLTQWVTQHMEIEPGADLAALIIDLLTARIAAAVTPNVDVTLLAETTAAAVLKTIGTNGHDAPAATANPRRYSGRRIDMSDEEMRTAVLASMQRMAAELGHTPTSKEWEANADPGLPTLPTIKARLHVSWNDLVTAAGLEPNKSIVQLRKEAKAENAEATFRPE